jgi:hypothetical protein
MRKRSLQPTRGTPHPRPRQKQQNRCSGVPIIQTRLRKVPPEREREEAAVPEAVERLISRGPPAGSGIPFEAWRSWHHYGFIAPGSPWQTGFAGKVDQSIRRKSMDHIGVLGEAHLCMSDR